MPTCTRHAQNWSIDVDKMGKNIYTLINNRLLNVFTLIYILETVLTQAVKNLLRERIIPCFSKVRRGYVDKGTGVLK